MKLLCDAVIVIEAFNAHKWRLLINTHKVFVGSIVAHKECLYYTDSNQKRTIDLESEAISDKVKILTSSAQEIFEIVKKVNDYRLIIDPGETESIALMLNPMYNDLVFCTADGAAVKAAHLFNLTSRVVSLEYCLGKSTKANLPYKCTERAMNHLKAEAIQYFGAVE